MSMLASTLAVSDGESVQYSIPSANLTHQLTAVIGGPGFTQEDNTDTPARVGGWLVDFIVSVDDFQAAFTGCEPKAGDKIVRTLLRRGSTVQHTYRVFSGNNVPAWDWGEAERITYRIHARYES